MMTRQEFRAIRKELGLSQTELAEALAYGNQSRISDIERGVVSVSPQAALLMWIFVQAKRFGAAAPLATAAERAEQSPTEAV